MTDKEKLGELLTSFDVGFRDDDNTITTSISGCRAVSAIRLNALVSLIFNRRIYV